MKIALTVLLLFVAGTCSAGELWRDDQGFRLEWAGWMDHEMFADWTGLRCGLTIPQDGWFLIEGAGALEVLIPGKGWVRDRGIMVADGCEPDPRTARDTAAPGAVNITEDFACERQGNRVLMVVRLPKMFKKTSPTQARWVPREVQYDVEETR
jgi:hypothetical protein